MLGLRSETAGDLEQRSLPANAKLNIPLHFSFYEGKVGSVIFSSNGWKSFDENRNEEAMNNANTCRFLSSSPMGDVSVIKNIWKTFFPFERKLYIALHWSMAPKFSAEIKVCGDHSVQLKAPWCTAPGLRKPFRGTLDWKLHRLPHNIRVASIRLSDLQLGFMQASISPRTAAMHDETQVWPAITEVWWGSH